jgi:hypothetical protein
MHLLLCQHASGMLLANGFAAVGSQLLLLLLLLERTQLLLRSLTEVEA